MSDQGFDFRPPPPRREAKRFEPPPWERDAFEQRAREQAERDAAAQELLEQEAAKAAEMAAETAAADPGVEAVARAIGGETAPTPGSPPAGTRDQPSAAAPASGAEVDEKQVAMMMLGLRAEEPAALQGAWVVNLGAGIVVTLIGLAVVIWGGAALAKPGLPTAGTLGAVILLGLGLGFLGMGGWLIFKALRQQGAL